MSHKSSSQLLLWAEFAFTHFMYYSFLDFLFKKKSSWILLKTFKYHLLGANKEVSVPAGLSEVKGPLQFIIPGVEGLGERGDLTLTLSPLRNGHCWMHAVTLPTRWWLTEPHWLPEFSNWFQVPQWRPQRDKDPISALSLCAMGTSGSL